MHATWPRYKTSDGKLTEMRDNAVRVRLSVNLNTSMCCPKSELDGKR